MRRTAMLTTLALFATGCRSMPLSPVSSVEPAAVGAVAIDRNVPDPPPPGSVYTVDYTDERAVLRGGDIVISCRILTALPFPSGQQAWAAGIRIEKIGAECVADPVCRESELGDFHEPYWHYGVAATIYRDGSTEVRVWQQTGEYESVLLGTGKLKYKKDGRVEVSFPAALIGGDGWLIEGRRSGGLFVSDPRSAGELQTLTAQRKQ